MLALDREVDGPQGERLGAAFVGVVGAGLPSLKWDRSTHKGEQACFLPMAGAPKVTHYHGDPVDVNAVLALAPAEPSRERPATPDPYRGLVIERGLFLRKSVPGKDAIICPFAAEHTPEPPGSRDGTDTSTVYFWPLPRWVQMGPGIDLSASALFGSPAGRFHPGAGGLDPGAVWRGQAGGAAPYDDMPPVEAYDGEDARRHTGGNSKAEHGESGNGKDAGRAGDGEILYRCMEDIEEKPIRWG